ncbi:DUF4397 domain-containing protein [Clostridium fermenticellae]|uniref:DUF4397 domain-containing protein n=1 Tax=Clostridium fermenticellae TaxID=2068654 RepID=A0A386H3W2_9CLOT|nr:DUF4397 domain-containing protein [Clostridium fermenticellae]AYD40382.1 DUF4397 domain-containing protein [Clostridium fermenticellae]
MFYCPYACTINNYYREVQTNSSIRIFNAAQGISNVDIYANGNLIVENLAHKKVSDYIPISHGNHNITVYPSGQKTNPILNTNVNIPENIILNVAITGTAPNISLFLIQEPSAAKNLGRPCIRLVNLSPDPSPIDIKLSDGTSIFTNVMYRDFTNYACIPTGNYTFTVTSSKDNNIELTIPNINLGNNYYTLYTIGKNKKTNSLEAVILKESGTHRNDLSR